MVVVGGPQYSGGKGSGSGGGGKVKGKSDRGGKGRLTGWSNSK